jgi:hypothetical protein
MDAIPYPAAHHAVRIKDRVMDDLRQYVFRASNPFATAQQ